MAICLDKEIFVKFSETCLEKSKIFENLPKKRNFSAIWFGNLPEEIEFFYPDPRTPDFKPDSRR